MNTRPPKSPQNQTEYVKQQLEHRAVERMTPTKERVTVPGLENLHLKSVDDVAKVLANVLKSRRNITSLVYVVGEYIEITSESDLSLTP